MPFNRGIIGKYANTSSRTGLVTAKEQFILAAGGFYPRFVSSEVTPTISRLLSLLVKTDGSNGGDNTSIVDSSTNTHTVTVNGNAQASSFSPYDPEGYSYYFDGTDDYLSIAYDSSLDITQQSKATIEAWIYIPSTHSTNDAIFTNRPVSAISEGVDLRLTSSRTIQYYETGAGSLVGTIVIPYREWTHVAVVKTGGGVYIYINGILDNSTEIFSSGTAGSNPTFIGRTGGGGTDYINAYLRDVRVVTGVDVYTSAFTPPTEPLTAISGTKLLTCHLPYLADGSTNGLSITINGNPYADPFSPYRGIPFDADLHGGSVYFDGTGDYLSVPAGSSLELGSGDYTIECWFYLTATPNNGDGLISMGQSGSTSTFASLEFSTDPAIKWFVRQYGTSTPIVASSTLKLNQWYHVAVTRSGTSHKMYINGSSVSTQTASYTNTIGNVFYVGCGWYATSRDFPGYISDARLTKSVVYSSAFTPPTAPISAVTNTALLIKGNESAIYDATGFSTIVLGGDATTSTAVTKYADSSVYLDGTGDYLYTDNIDFPDDFTIEGWFNFSALSSNRLLFDTYSSGTSGTWQLYWRSTGTSLAWYDTSSTSVKAQDSNTSRISTGTWYHIAATRNNNKLDIWVDGASVANTSGYTTDLTHSNPLVLGSQYSTSTNYFNGYMEDVRVTKGLSRYPWIPEKETLTAVSGTDLLVAHAATLVDGSSAGRTLTAGGNAAVSTFAPKSGMYSIAFDGTNDNISVPTNSLGGTGDFTLEYWIYFNNSANANNAGIIGDINLSGPGGWAVWWNNTVGEWRIGNNSTYGGGLTDYDGWSFTNSNNKWYHHAWVRDGGTLSFFIDGTKMTRTTTTGNMGTANLVDQTSKIGTFNDNTMDFNGYISNLRIIEGTALYADSFTPPTAALT